jgi:hypothetical protein
MQTSIVKTASGGITGTSFGPILPAIIAQAGDHAARRFIEFFTATIRNAHTRRAYGRAVADFLTRCEQRHLTLTGIEPLHVTAYIEQLTGERRIPVDRIGPRTGASSCKGGSKVVPGWPTAATAGPGPGRLPHRRPSAQNPRGT